jgi:uncharacterized repeat protein (TIGR02543 family)
MGLFVMGCSSPTGSPEPGSQTASYTVAFDTKGGSPTPNQQTVAGGRTVSDPGSPARASEGLFVGTVDPDTISFTFEGWYTGEDNLWDFDNDSVTGNLTLYAKWIDPTDSAADISSETGNNILEKALAWIAKQTLTVSTLYTIVLDGNCSMAGVTSSSNANINTENAVITLLGKGPGETEISLSANGSLFYITAGELILDDHITLSGLDTNNASLVYVDGASASLTMKAGAKISGNSATNGGGVFVVNGDFTMEDGEISDNSAANGGGVAVGGSFIMKGGKITGNSVSSPSLGGGGVIVSNGGDFTMEGGEISGNFAISLGGGVVINGSDSGGFSKTGGVIYGSDALDNSLKNTVDSGDTNGHAVYYWASLPGWSFYYRDLTLDEEDDISTGTLPGSGTEHNWTKK